MVVSYEMMMNAFAELKTIAAKWEKEGKKEQAAIVREEYLSGLEAELTRDYREKFPNAKRYRLPRLRDLGITAWAVSADGKRLATAECRVRSSAGLGLQIFARGGDTDFRELLQSEFLSRRETAVRVWDVGSARAVKPAKVRKPPATLNEALAELPIREFCFDPQQSKALIAAADRPLVTVSDLSQPIGALALSPDGKWLAAGDLDGGLRVLEAATGQVVLKCRAHSGPVTDLNFAPAEPILVTAGEDGTAKLWRLDGKETDKGTVVFPK
jgi:WD40 repeat protein